MDAVGFDPSACAAPAGLDLGPVAGSHPEKIVKFGIRLLTDEDWGEDVLQPSDDISAVVSNSEYGFSPTRTGMKTSFSRPMI